MSRTRREAHQAEGVGRALDGLGRPDGPCDSCEGQDASDLGRRPEGSTGYCGYPQCPFDVPHTHGGIAP
jgi:hypothetical protein